MVHKGIFESFPREPHDYVGDRVGLVIGGERELDGGLRCIPHCRFNFYIKNTRTNI